MKKINVIKVITISTSCILAILSGYALAKSEHSVQQIANEMTKATSIEGSNNIDGNEISKIAASETNTPSAMVPENYNQANKLISNYQDRKDLAKKQNSTFNIGVVVDELKNAIQLMEAEDQDCDILLYCTRQLLFSHGYPTDNSLFTEDLITRAFHNAGWKIAPNEE